MQLWAKNQSFSRKTAINDRGIPLYDQAPNNKATKAKQSKIVLLKNEKAYFKMDTSWLGTYHTCHRTSSLTEIKVEKAASVRIKQRKKSHELKCDGKCWLSRALSKACSKTSILGAHSSRTWTLLLLTIITAHICHGDAMAHELTVRTQHHQSSTFHSQFTTNYRAKRSTQYSQLLSSDGHWMNKDDNANFRPVIPKDISPEFIAHSVFTRTGQYRVFQSTTSDLRETVKMEQKQGKIPTVQSIHEMVGETLKKPIKRTTTMMQKAGTMQDNAAQKTRIDLIDAATAKTYNVTKIPTSTQSIELELNEPTKNRAFPSATVTEQQSIVNIGKAQKDMKVVKFKALPTSVMTASFIDTSQNIVHKDIRELEALLVEYAESFFNQAQYEPSKHLINELQKNHTTADGMPIVSGPYKERPTRHANPHHHNHNHHHYYYYDNQNFHEHHKLPPPAITRKADGDISLNIPRAMQSGRLLFSTGLKKMLWPIFMGLQVLKSLLFALFLPTLIGSFGKLVGKGIVTGSAPLFIRPADAPQDLDFRDNTINFDDDKFAVVHEGTKEDGYAYGEAEASQTHYTYHQADINRIEQQNKMPDTYLSALQTIGSASFKNSGSLSGSSSNGLGGGLGAPLRTKPAAPANTNNFQTFQKVPASSLLLSNYDPFYSPLLSRLDSVFAQLKLNSDNENCREKLICLMYANPAKYAPYSNLVSAQLSRELNELRKPTSDNPDILRFFKYMRAAKDGQDGIDCEKSFDRCKEFKDFENPAMVSTYHDINKLVQARKLA